MPSPIPISDIFEIADSDFDSDTEKKFIGIAVLAIPMALIPILISRILD